MSSGILDILRPKFDQLDGKQTTQKTVGITSIASGIGFCGGAFTLSVKPAGVAEGLLRLGSVTASFAAVGAIFAVTTGATASLRESDSPLNYFIGGCTSGLFIGARTQSITVGSASCATLGSIAAFYKFWKKNDWGPLIPDRKY
ncbi:NADH dehydrogenase [ubiquinone] 1 alpha subcomplex subunit 11-like [Diadema antillarum]|uniref:NADH dehydrogenase [ubiquinone] 1 alpha subcomplex subunit 11-like n=1 Tax=Diadema antillarum TaxID=105358 RepID=UPI003A84E690